MLDIRFVRENLETVAEAMKNRNASWDSDLFTKLDEERRAVIAEEESLLAKRNSISKSIGKLLSEGKKDEAEAAKAEVSSLKEQIAELGKKREEAEEAIRTILISTPNIPSDSTPVGADENDNPEVRRWGTPREFDFEFKAHWDLGTDLNIVDFERAVKLAKSRFVLLGGLGARLERAIINFMADTHTSRGYKEWWCPVMA
ncbi:MAG: serine--tRNA ligase, partial [Anaerotardibacter sp.]